MPDPRDIDRERLDWLASGAQRLYDVYWHILKTDDTLRTAIDKYRLSVIEPTPAPVMVMEPKKS